MVTLFNLRRPLSQHVSSGARVMVGAVVGKGAVRVVGAGGREDEAAVQVSEVLAHKLCRWFPLFIITHCHAVYTVVK